MTNSERIRQTLIYVVITIATFIVLQTVLVIMHEFTHSTVAWLLGHMQSPLDIVWGNPITLHGWDEGVSYSQLYASGHFHAAAIIGVSPLILHTVIVVLVLVLLQRKWMQTKKWLFHVLFWFMIANFMELIAYLTMGAYWSGGDVYHLVHGLGISALIPLIGGTPAIMVGLYFLCVETLPRMYAVFAPNNPLNQWVILLMTVSALFLWGSGLRLVLQMYPHPQWLFGFIDFAMLGLTLFFCNPSRAWVISRIEKV